MICCEPITKDIVNNITPLKILINDYSRRDDNQLKLYSFDAVRTFFNIVKKVSYPGFVRFLNENKKLVKELIQSLVVHLKVHKLELEHPHLLKANFDDPESF